MYVELGYGSQSYRIFTLYPDLDKACQAAISFVGNRFPGNEDVLIKEMIRDAFQFYQKAESSFENPRHAFIRGLCNRAICLYRVRYCAGAKEIAAVWIPMLQEITTFEKNHEVITILNEPDPQQVNEESATRLFAARILPGHLFSEVFSRGYQYDTAA